MNPQSQGFSKSAKNFSAKRQSCASAWRSCLTISRRLIASLTPLAIKASWTGERHDKRKSSFSTGTSFVSIFSTSLGRLNGLFRAANWPVWFVSAKARTRATRGCLGTSSDASDAPCESSEPRASWTAIGTKPGQRFGIFCKGNYAEPHTGFLKRGVSYMCALLLWAIIICAIVLPNRFIFDKYQIDTGWTNLHIGWPEEGWYNIDVNHFPRELCSINRCFVDPVVIQYFAHQISMESPRLYIDKLRDFECAIRKNGLMRTYNLRNALKLFSIQQNPWLRERFNCRSASNISVQVFCGGISTIGEQGCEHNLLGSVISLINRNMYLGGLNIDESPLANNVIFMHKPRLPHLYASIGQNGEQGEECYPIFWLLPVAMFFMSVILFYHGLPRRNFVGFAITITGAMLFIVAVFSALMIGDGYSFSCPENAYRLPRLLRMSHTRAAERKKYHMRVDRCQYPFHWRDTGCASAADAIMRYCSPFETRR